MSLTCCSVLKYFLPDSDNGQNQALSAHNVLWGVHWATWPACKQTADRADRHAFTLFTSSPGENQCPEDQPREGPRPAEPGGHHQSPEQLAGPTAQRRERRRTQLPTVQPCTANMVWPVWRLHLGPLQAEPAVCQWVGLCGLLVHLGVCTCGYVCAYAWSEMTATWRERGNLVEQKHANHCRRRTKQPHVQLAESEIINLLTALLCYKRPPCCFLAVFQSTLLVELQCSLDIFLVVFKKTYKKNLTSCSM